MYHQVSSFEVLHEVRAHSHNALHDGADCQTGNDPAIRPLPTGKHQNAQFPCKRLLSLTQSTVFSDSKRMLVAVAGADFSHSWTPLVDSEFRNGECEK